MPTLALCIPAYNAAWSLSQLFASVDKQSISFNEILLYDDCSTDDTPQLAKQHGATVISGDVNRGCSFGKNRLAMHAKSDWLFFLDTDDELLPGFVENVMEAIAQLKEADMILLGYLYINKQTGEILNTPNYCVEELNSDAAAFMINNKVVNSSVVRRKKFLEIGGFDTDKDILYVEDRAYAVKCAMAGLKISILQKNIFTINYYPASMSAATPHRWLSATVNLWRKVYTNTGNQYKEALCSQLFQNAVWAARHSQWEIVDQSLKLAEQILPVAAPAASRFFLFLFKINPLMAYWIREMLLRLQGKKLSR